MNPDIFIDLRGQTELDEISVVTLTLFRHNINMTMTEIEKLAKYVNRALDIEAKCDASNETLDALEKVEARVKALERAIKRYSPCTSCKFDGALSKTEPCIHCNKKANMWQFDQARFERKEKNNE